MRAVLAQACLKLLLFWCVIAQAAEELATCSDDSTLLQTRPAIVPAQRQIPLQLLLTGKYAAVEDLPPDALKNVQATLRKSPGLSLRYLNNTGCRSFLTDNFDNDLVELFDMEKHGSFRGDICRTAVLSKEGGFYIDLDFELHVDMDKLVDPETTLMTVVSGTQGEPVILNALIAVKPNSSVMIETMAKIREWYMGDRQGLLGPSTMAAAIAKAMKQQCPSQASLNEVGKTLQDQWSCGSEKFRFYKEDYLGDEKHCASKGQVVCPLERAQSPYTFLKYGVFSTHSSTSAEAKTDEMRLIGWPRYAACAQMGCGINGGMASL